MNLNECKNLRPGDEVYWTDPDTENPCSKSIRILIVKVSDSDLNDDGDLRSDDDQVVTLTGISEGNSYHELQCYPGELS